LTSNIKICYPHKKKQKGKNMNEQLASKIRSRLSGGESYDHMSPSSLNIPIQKYIISYVCSTQAMRRQNKVGYKAHSGNLVGNVSQRLLSKYIFKAAEKEEVKPELFDKIFEYELDVINKFNEPRDERDAQCRIEMIPSCKASIENTLKLVKEVFGDEPLTSERYVHVTPPGLILDILGRIDFETSENSTENKKGKFLELKSKPVNFRKGKNGLTQTIQKLPATIDDCEETYMKQVAFYWKATGKKAYLGYVNSEEYKIFEPEDDRLEYYYKQLINKAFTIQNLLEISEGDPKVMAKFVEMPDIRNFYYSDLTEQQVEITKQLWGM
jgi:hypothetical protein